MADSEKLDLILIKLESGIQEVKKDVLDKFDTLDNKMQDINKGLSGRIDSLGGEVQDIKKSVRALKRQLAKSTAGLKDMDKMILDEVERVHIILENHTKDKSVHMA